MATQSTTFNLISNTQCGASILYFMLVDSGRRHFPEHFKKPFIGPFLTSGIAATLAWWIEWPLEYMKCQIQSNYGE
jgi:solute carrier family 25 carnitine/acylcarnitine transporter 20/29